MIRYGKSSDSILSLKSSFLENNDALREQLLAIGRLYAAQPLRLRCKICLAGLAREADFRKHGVGYVFCGRCGHLNGQHEDTEEFCAAVYTEDGGKSYAANYAALDRAAYEKRIAAIYLPKAEFLAEALTSLGEQPAALSYMDLGAGAGYFVAALRRLGFASAHGHEVSRAQAAIAAAMLGEGAVRLHDLRELPRIAAETRAEVASMIGVLEHLQDPRSVLESLRANEAVRYLYVSVPLFSSSVFIETVFSDVMPRQLAGGHTHLFTERSLDWMAREFGWTRVAEWWFGTDLVDFYRSVLVSLRQSGRAEGLIDRWGEQILPALDRMQLALDESRLSSEVHMLFRAA